MKRILITGGSGFFGGLLKRRLLSEGHSCHNIDLVADSDRHPALVSTQGDIRDKTLVRTIFERGSFDAAIHCAAQLAHDTIDSTMLWTSNVDGTRTIADAAREFHVPKLINISTNCLWASNLGHEVAEDEPPNPIELYGNSKLAAEQLLKDYAADLTVITIRCPTIIDSGRLGLLAILFEFIQDGRKVWVVGDGGNRYQFIYAQDLATACILSLDYTPTEPTAEPILFHIGSENVCSLGEVYQSVIDAAGTSARVAQLPKAPTIAAMKLAHKLGVSPLGPYHYRMIAEDFIFSTTKIRKELGWTPTLTNQQMMIEAYIYYARERAAIHARKDVSAHSKAAPMGIIRLLKWIS